MASTLPGPPANNSLIQLDPTNKDRSEPFFISKEWLDWLQLSVVPGVQAPSKILKTITLTGQMATIGAVPIPVGALANGLYRVTWYLRVTTPDPVSSSLTVSIGFTDGGVSCSLSGAPVTGNNTQAVQSGSVLVASDAAAPITYGVVYASNTPKAMVYTLTVMLEQI